LNHVLRKGCVVNAGESLATKTFVVAIEEFLVVSGIAREYSENNLSVRGWVYRVQISH